jgi:PAS domain-containing protein
MQVESAPAAASFLAGRGFGKIYDAVPGGLCIVGHDLRFVLVNRKMSELTGRPPANDIGRHLHEVFPGLAGQLEPFLLRALRGEQIGDVEVRGLLLPGVPCAGRAYLVSLEPLAGTGAGSTPCCARCWTLPSASVPRRI